MTPTSPVTLSREAAVEAFLRSQVLALQDLVNDHMAGKLTDARWRNLAAATIEAVSRAVTETPEGLDPERLWGAVMTHVGKVVAHTHPVAESCGEAILRDLAGADRSTVVPSWGEPQKEEHGG